MSKATLGPAQLPSLLAFIYQHLRPINTICILLPKPNPKIKPIHSKTQAPSKTTKPLRRKMLHQLSTTASR